MMYMRAMVEKDIELVEQVTQSHQSGRIFRPNEQDRLGAFWPVFPVGEGRLTSGRVGPGSSQYFQLELMLI